MPSLYAGDPPQGCFGYPSKPWRDWDIFITDEMQVARVIALKQELVNLEERATPICTHCARSPLNDTDEARLIYLKDLLKNA